MGLFGNIFGSNSEAESKPSFDWEQITTEAKLAEIDEVSNEKLCVIFKHSTRCGISRMALRQFENEAKNDREEVAFYLLDLISFRAISQQIAEHYKVLHESPQMILIKNKEVVAHNSHSGIDATQIEKFL